MEVEECGGDTGKPKCSHGNCKNNLNKEILDFKEIIRDIDEAINNAPVMLKLKSDYLSISWARNDISVTSGYSVDTLMIVSQPTPSRLLEDMHEAHAMVINSAHAKEVNFYMGWGSNNVYRKINKSELTRSVGRSKGKTKCHSGPSKTNLVGVRVSKMRLLASGP